MKKRYSLLKGFRYYSKRYGKYKTVKNGFLSDGATGAIDISGPVCVLDTWIMEVVKVSRSWLVHDSICDDGVWDDGTPITNFQASMVLSDILRSENRYFRQFYWFPATFLFGGGKCRERMIKT